jgi:galactose mutarotase-like enzyme
MLNPSGEQWEIRHGDQRAVVVEVGGGLREYEAGGAHVLDGYAVDEMCQGGRGQNLIPWPNRLADGCYEFGDRSLQVPLNEPGLRNAIHGLVRWSSWRLADRRPAAVAVEHILHPQPGYPFTLGLRIAYVLGDAGLAVTVTATNLGRERLPYGVGHHPYLTLGEPTIDTAEIELRATRAVAVDDRKLPTGLVDVAGSEIDFRRRRALGSLRLDVAFTELERDARGRAWLEMQTSDGGRRVAVWMDAAYTHVMLFTGDTLQSESRRRRGLGVEPMTCAPNAFAARTGFIVLEPAASHECEWGIGIG